MTTAPEVVKHGIPTRQADVWMLGLAFLTLLLGSSSETADLLGKREKSPDEWIQMVESGQLNAQLSEQIIPIAFASSGQVVPEWIQQLILSCFNPKPEQRPSVNDILALIPQLEPSPSFWAVVPRKVSGSSAPNVYEAIPRQMANADYVDVYAQYGPASHNAPLTYVRHSSKIMAASDFSAQNSSQSRPVVRIDTDHIRRQYAGNSLDLMRRAAVAMEEAVNMQQVRRILHCTFLWPLLIILPRLHAFICPCGF